MKGIVEIIGDVVKEMSGNLTIVMPADIENDRFEEVKNPELNYIFGSAQYVKDKLDEYSKVPSTSEPKFPLVVLFCPVTEKRDSLDYYSKVSLNILIACSSTKSWSNERRLYASFINILRPIYERLIEVVRMMEGLIYTMTASFRMNILRTTRMADTEPIRNPERK